MNKILGLLLLSVLFVACGSDDDDNKTEFTLANAECKLTHNLGLASSGSTPTTSTTTKTLNDLLSSYTFTPPITKGVMSLTSGTSITVNGLNDREKLENFSLKINGITETFGTITSSNKELYIDTKQNYFKDVFASMISQQKLAVEASYKPSFSLSKEDQVKVDIVFKGNFTYYK